MATDVNILPSQETPVALSGISWKRVAWFGALLVACYAPILYVLGQVWVYNEDMGHGFFVPLVAAYIVWKRRDALAKIVPEPNNWGLVLVLWGAVQLMLGALGAEIFLTRTAFLVSLVGVIWYLGGTRLLRELAFPLFLLLFMIPIPAIIYSRITLPLQIFATRVAETILSVFSIPVLRDGNVLELASQKLNVVEACSGIRSLLTLSFLSLVYGYLFDKKPWMRWVLLAGTIPIAIAANAARVTLTGMLSEIRTDLAQGFFHLAEGWVLFLVALTLLVLFHRLVNVIYDRFHARTA